MNELGLGVVISMRDLFTNTANRVRSSVLSLDSTVAAVSKRIDRNFDRMQTGMMAVGAGISTLAVPAGLLASYADTQAALGTLASLGVKDLNALELASERFVNQWAGFTKGEFIRAAYDVRSAISGLSDEATGAFTANAALTAKATKASIQEMVGAFTTSYGIFKPMMADLSDMQFGEALSGALSQTVKSFKTNGKEMADAIKNIGGVAAIANTPLQEQLAILGTLQSSMPGGEAGTLYKSFALKASKAGLTLGLSFTDAQDRMKGIVPILREIKNRFPDLGKSMQSRTLQEALGDEAYKFVTQMIKGLEPLEANINAIAGAMKTGTANAEKMAHAMNIDIGSRFRLIGQQARNLAEILGRTLVPVITPITNGISAVLLRLQELARAYPGLTGGLMVTVSAIGAALVAVGGVISAIGLVGVIVPGIKAGFAAIAVGVKGAMAAIAANFLPITLGIAAVIGGVILLKRAWKTNFGGMRTTLTNLWTKIRLFARGARDLIMSLSDGTGQISAKLHDQMKAAGVWDFAVSLFRLFYRVRSAVVAFGNAMGEAFSKVGNILAPTVKALGSAFWELQAAGVAIVESLFGVGNAINHPAFQTVGFVVGKVVGMAVQGAAYLLKGVLTLVTGLLKTITWGIGAVGGLVRFLSTTIPMVVSGLYKNVLPIRLLVRSFVFLGETVSTVWKALSGRITVWQGIKDIGAALGRYLMTPFRFFRDLAETAADRTITAWQGVSKTLMRVGRAFSWFIFPLTWLTKQALQPFRQLPSLVGGVSANVVKLLAWPFRSLARIGMGSIGKWLGLTGQGVDIIASKVRSLFTLLAGLKVSRPFDFRSLVRTASQGFLAIGENARTSLVGAFQIGLEALKTKWRATVQHFGRPIQGLIGRIRNLFRTIRAGVQALRNTPLFQGMEKALSKISTLARNLAGAWPGSGIPGKAVAGLIPPPATVSDEAALRWTTRPQRSTPLAPISRPLATTLSVTPQLAGSMPGTFAGRMWVTPRLGPMPDVAARPMASSKARSRKNDQRHSRLADLLTRPEPAKMRGMEMAGQLDAVQAELAAIKALFAAQVDRPISLNLSTQVDGREIARSVLENIRDSQTRHYR
ncbi:Phage tail tape measure protein [Sulfidibacter corallicola]|uniref:Phage tail tape measure protein n=1 Tax=Sulfidibacter corallicola TaxID=2818388 RepID=A0A8A4TKD4_SULCO|nr:phage tail tape measure protein [Sulfidibacter corallicola]QTD49664.1 phage tail tape measure protein [Sulfidibacter corallicola]